jgi:hypothetical protein
VRRGKKGERIFLCWGLYFAMYATSFKNSMYKAHSDKGVPYYIEKNWIADSTRACKCCKNQTGVGLVHWKQSFIINS